MHFAKKQKCARFNSDRSPDSFSRHDTFSVDLISLWVSEGGLHRQYLKERLGAKSRKIQVGFFNV